MHFRTQRVIRASREASQLLMSASDHFGLEALIE